MADLKKRRSSFDAEIKEREEPLKAISDLMGLSGQWINVASYRYKVASQAGWVSFDQNLLKANLGQLKWIDQEKMLVALELAQKPANRLSVFISTPSIIKENNMYA